MVIGILENKFLILWVVLSYHHFQCPFHTSFELCFWLVLDSSWWKLLILCYQNLSIWYLTHQNSCPHAPLCSVLLLAGPFRLPYSFVETSGLDSAFLFTFPYLSHDLPYTGHCFRQCLVPQYLQFSFHFILFYTFFLLPILLSFCLSLLIQSMSFASLKLSNTAFCALHFYPLGPN